MTASDTLLEIRDLTKHFTVTKGFPRPVTTTVGALDGISFAVARGEAFGLVGESGCGKSTAARTVLRLIPPDAGRIRFADIDVTRARGSALQRLRGRMQIVPILRSTLDARSAKPCAARPDIRLRQPRPRRGALVLLACCGDVPRSHRGGRPGLSCVQRTETSVYAHAAGCFTYPRPEHTSKAATHRRRNSIRSQSTAGMPFPLTLPPCIGRMPHNISRMAG
jgi:energy-coupling factor transporter ATP-binding protein EcfA2